jgi:hypothetical protein
MLPTPYGTECASAPGARDISFANVVAPFAPTVVPFLAADPATAHDGQKLDRRIVDMVVEGSPAP